MAEDATGVTDAGARAGGGKAKPRNLPFHSPREIVGPSASVGDSNANGFFLGDGGADSYTCTSRGVTSAKRNRLSDRLGGRVLLAEGGSGEVGRDTSAPEAI